MFHPDLIYDIVRMRTEERIAGNRRRFGDRFRRHPTPPVERRPAAPSAASPRHLAAVPRPDRDQPGRDDPRVA